MSARYWDKHILRWDAGRYERHVKLPVQSWRARHTRLRQSVAFDLVKPFLDGASVVELGCGTGRLAPLCADNGAKQYLGIDHSRVAIDAAIARNRGSRIRFELASAAAAGLAGADLVVSLGVLDWLTDDELRSCFARHGCAAFLHTFSEQRLEPAQLVQRALRRVDRTVRPRAVRPRYLTLDHLRSLMPPAWLGSLVVFRHPGLRFSTFVSSLPLARRSSP